LRTSAFLFSSPDLLPGTYSVFLADRDLPDSNWSRGGAAALAAVCCKHRYDLELTRECVGMETAILDGFSLLVRKHRFPPDTDVKIINIILILFGDLVKSKWFPYYSYREI
jgi:hypothetical protein